MRAVAGAWCRDGGAYELLVALPRKESMLVFKKQIRYESRGCARITAFESRVDSRPTRSVAIDKSSAKNHVDVKRANARRAESARSRRGGGRGSEGGRRGESLGRRRAEARGMNASRPSVADVRGTAKAAGRRWTGFRNWPPRTSLPERAREAASEEKARIASLVDAGRFTFPRHRRDANHSYRAGTAFDDHRPEDERSSEDETLARRIFWRRRDPHRTTTIINVEDSSFVASMRGFADRRLASHVFR